MPCCPGILVGAYLHWPGYLHRAILKKTMLLLSKGLLRSTWIWMLDQTLNPWELHEGFHLKHSFNILESSAHVMLSHGKTQLEVGEKSQNLVWQFTESQKKLGWRSFSRVSCTKFTCLSCSHNTSTRPKVLKHLYLRQWSLYVSQLLLYSHGAAIQFSCVGPDLKY